MKSRRDENVKKYFLKTSWFWWCFKGFFILFWCYKNSNRRRRLNFKKAHTELLSILVWSMNISSPGRVGMVSNYKLYF